MRSMWLSQQLPTVRHLGLVLLLLTGCSGSDAPAAAGPPSNPEPGSAGAGGESGAEVSCSMDSRVDAYKDGLTKTGPAGFTVTLDGSDPAVPFHGDNSWSITVRDAAGKPLEAAQISVSAKMPDHGHMSPTTPEATATDAGGHSQVSGLNLFMAGVWQIDLKITADGEKQPVDDVSFVFCVEG